MTDNVIKAFKSDSEHKEDLKKIIIEAMEEATDMMKEEGVASFGLVFVDGNGNMVLSCRGADVFEITGLFEVGKHSAMAAYAEED